MGMVDIIRERCSEKGITIAKLERDLDFSNGYIGKLKGDNMPIDRVRAVADYLNLPIERLLGIKGNIDDYCDLEIKQIVKEVMAFSGCTKEDIAFNKGLRLLLIYYMRLSQEQREYFDASLDIFTRIAEMDRRSKENDNAN